MRLLSRGACLALALMLSSVTTSSVWSQPRPTGVNIQNRANENRIRPQVGSVDTASRYGYNPRLTTANVNINPSYSTGGYGYGGYPYTTPAEGYLRGTADVTAATGQYWNDIQSA